MSSSTAASSTGLLSPDRQTARLYGHSAIRDEHAQPLAQQYAEQQHSQQYDSLSPTAALSARSTGRHGGQPRTAFYNTRAGAAIIADARADLSARAKPEDHALHRLSGGVQDNHQRAYHAECVLPCDIATLPPTSKAQFQQYPLQEFNRFDPNARQSGVAGSAAKSGPSTHPRLKSVPYTRPGGPSQLDVARRHDLVANLKKNHSISNYDHGHTFLAKHTNNLLSC